MTEHLVLCWGSWRQIWKSNNDVARLWREERGVAVAYYVFRAINFRVHLRETVNPINFRLPEDL